MTPKEFVGDLARFRRPSVFNPYGERCSLYDRADGVERRKRNLEKFIAAALNCDVDTIWVARDLGYRGGRRTGIPLTDEIHLDRVGRLLGGVGMERATIGPMFGERTAATTWKAISLINQPIFLWNIFPFHPHEPSNPLSNRCHTASEQKDTSKFLPIIIDMIKPKRLIAIGQDARRALGNIPLHVIGVRHPSYGGQRDFMAALFNIYGLT